jgi:hypothetical protein
LLCSCAVSDSHNAHDAQSRLMGMSEVDLESCLGVPDQHSSFGNTDVLTYYATSTSNDSYSVPIIGGYRSPTAAMPRHVPAQGRARHPDPVFR